MKKISQKVVDLSPIIEAFKNESEPLLTELGIPPTTPVTLRVDLLENGNLVLELFCEEPAPVL